MPLENIDELFLEDWLFSQCDGSRSVEEMREELEWQIEEYFANYEPEKTPVISPFSIYMAKWSQAAYEIEHMSASEFKRAVEQGWNKREERRKYILSHKQKKENMI